MIPEVMATRERVAWIFHEKARRLHSEANNGKAGPPDLGCLPAGASFIRGGVLPEIGWFSSTREVSVGRGGLYPKAVVSLTWPYACRLFQPPSARSGKLPPRDPLLMNTSRFLAGLPSFSATEVRRRMPLARFASFLPPATTADGIFGSGFFPSQSSPAFSRQQASLSDT